MKRGKLAIISGPSAGVGKDTLLQMFLEKHPQWHQPPSTTTREPRPGETGGKDMIFVSRETFNEWEKAGKFLETDYHASNWYGTLQEPVEMLLSQGVDVILRIDVNGALIVKQKLPEAILIFVNAENEAALESRMKSRGSESEEQVYERLELAKQEILLADKFDHIVVNATNKQEKALQEIEAILA